MYCRVRLWEGSLLIFCLLHQFPTGGDSRRYDKCSTRDGRPGVCVVKRYCREAHIQSLVPCDDDENHCCPIPTTVRSAPIPTDEFANRPKGDVDRDRARWTAPPREDRISRHPEDEDRRPHTPEPQFDEGGPKKPRREPVDDFYDDRSRRHPTEATRRPPTSEPRLYDDRPKKPRRDRVTTDDSYDDRPNKPRRDRVDDSYDDRPNKPRRDRVDDSYDDRSRYYPVDEERRSSIPQYPPEDRPKKPRRDPVVDPYDDRPRYSQGGEDRRYSTPQQYPVEERPKKPRRDPDDDRYEDGLRYYPTDEERRSSNPQHRPMDDRPKKPRRNPIDDDSYDRRVRNDPPPRRVEDDYDRRRPMAPLDREREPPPPPREYSRRPQTTPVSSSKAPIRFPQPPKVPSCGVKPYELFIAGGQEAEEHEWPWMTAIFRRHQDSRPKTFLCGGSLLSTKYVLTAAHCFVNNYVVLPASSFVVRLGSHMLSSGEEYTVSQLYIHPNHSGSDFFNDIALLRLAGDVYVTDKVAPICLPPPGMEKEDLVDRVATVAGWGDTAFRTGGARILQHVTVPIVSSEECSAAYSRVRGAAFLARGSDHVICAGLREGGKDACLGDSGGPLMLKMVDDTWAVIGIVSLGYKCAEPGYPGVYTRVTHYMPWIRNTMKRRQ